MHGSSCDRFLCRGLADRRRRFNGGGGTVQSLFQPDPLAGHLFVSRNCNDDKLRLTTGTRWLAVLHQQKTQSQSSAYQANDDLANLSAERALSKLPKSPNKTKLGLVATV